MLSKKVLVFLVVTLGLLIVACTTTEWSNPADENGTDYTPADSIDPVITIVGDNPINLTIGDKYVAPEVTAYDSVDGDITDEIIISGDSVDTSVKEVYTVIYTVLDEIGNSASSILSVIVRVMCQLTLTLISKRKNLKHFYYIVCQKMFQVKYQKLQLPQEQKVQVLELAEAFQ
jgi:hypothetical protein